MIFFRAQTISYLVQDVIAPQVVYLTQVKYRSELTLPPAVWSILIDIFGAI